MLPPLTIVGRDPGRAVTFPLPLLLAPMEGITEPVFRDLVIALGGVGGACTEFIRIANAPLPRKVIARHLASPGREGPAAAGCPIGVQLMAPDDQHLAATIHAAEAEGAAWIDLNFGCPAPVVFDKCAGSALLARPELIGRIVAGAVGATGLPVSAKIRAGIDACAHLDEIVQAVAEAGAAMLTVHARLRIHAYSEPAHWEWIAAACAARDRSGRRLPVVGNGGVDTPADVARLFAATTCDAVMIGRAALADPWIFAGAGGAPPATGAAAAGFALRYLDALASAYGERTALARTKQLVKYYRAGQLFSGREDERQRLLRVQSVDDLRQFFLAQVA